MHLSHLKRRDFVTLLGGAVTWPLLARAQEVAMPVAGFIRDGSAEANARNVIAFRKGLNETGYVEGQNVKYLLAHSHSDRMSAAGEKLTQRGHRF